MGALHGFNLAHYVVLLSVLYDGGDVTFNCLIAVSLLWASSCFFI